MVEHWCGGTWKPGTVGACPDHARSGRAPNLTPYNQRTHVTTEGVASTGQVSPKGTVAHREHFDGRVDAKASVKPVTVNLSELKEQYERRRS